MRLFLKAIYVGAAAAAIAATARPALAEPLRTPRFVSGETVVYKVEGSRDETDAFQGPRPIEYNATTLRTTDEFGRRVIRHINREVRDNDTVSSWRFDFSDSQPNTRCLSFSRVVKDAAGTEIYREYSSLAEPFLKYPDNITHALAAPFLFTGLDWSSKKQGDINIWAADGKPTHMFMVVRGREKVTVPAGTFDAYHVLLVVDKKEVIEPWGPLGNIIARFIPSFHFWYEAEQPHRFLKMRTEFSASIPGSPFFRVDLKEIKKAVD